MDDHDWLKVITLNLFLTIAIIVLVYFTPLADQFSDTVLGMSDPELDSDDALMSEDDDRIHITASDIVSFHLLVQIFIILGFITHLIFSAYFRYGEKADLPGKPSKEVYLHVYTGVYFLFLFVGLVPWYLVYGSRPTAMVMVLFCLVWLSLHLMVIADLLNRRLGYIGD